MKIKLKKPMAIILTVAMIAGLLAGLIALMPTTAYGLTYEEGDIWIDTDGQQMSIEHANQWEYTLSGEDVTLTRYKGDVVDGKIVGKVPASINGNLVKSLVSTFNRGNNSKLRYLTDAPVLPSTIIEMIGTFRSCLGLVNVEIPYGVINMESAFFGCEELVNVEIPDTVTNLRYTFRGCTKLVNVEIPNSVTNTNYTFQECSSLTGDIYIPDNIDNLSGMFDNTVLPITMKYSQFNTKAQGITVPSNVTKEAYLIEDTSGDSNWIGADGNVMTLNETKLWEFSKYLSRYSVKYIGPIVDGRIVGHIPAIVEGNQITHLGRQGDSGVGAFSGNSELVHAPVIPDGVKHIGQIYRNNTSLTGDVYIPDSVEGATDAFSGTERPITVYFNNSIPVGYTFANNIAQTIFPDNVTKISTDTDVWIGTDGKVMSPEHKGQWAYRYANESSIRLSKYTGKYTEDGRIIGSVPATINGIPITHLEGIFQHDKNIKIAPELPNTVVMMSSTFSYATNLQTFPNELPNLTTMTYTYRGCTSLTGDIMIPDSANKWNSLDNVFQGTSKPITMYYNASNTGAAGTSVPSNVTKVAINSLEDLESSKPIDGVDPEGDIVVEVSSPNGNYSIEVGNELQLQASVSRDDLEYRWVIQDIYDINGQNEYYATIDGEGVVTGIDAGYVVVGLMVKFEDGTEETYGLTLIEVTKDGRYGYGSQYLYDMFGGYGGSYGGGWNYGYSSSGSLGSYFTADSGGSGFNFNPDLSGGGTGETGGGTTEGIEVFVDSNKVNFPDKQPTISNENILVPIRFVMEELNFKVYWDTVERKAVLRKTESDGNKLEIIMEPNKSTMLVNGSSYPLGAKVRIESPGRLMLPGGELVKAMKDIYYKQETPSSNLYQGYYYSEDVEGTESKFTEIPEIEEWTDNSNLVELTDANEEEVLSDLPSTGDEGGTGGDNPIDEGMASEDSNLQIIGLVEPITRLQVAVPLNINFTIDAERNFIKPNDLKIVSNCPAPLKVLIYEVDKKTDAPNIVKENTYTDSEWNNLSRKQTSENIALSLNNINLSTTNVELGTLKSAFRETQELDIDLTSKYGKAWANKEAIEFSYNIAFVIEMQ